MPTNNRWSQHFEQTKNYPPSPLLIKALPYVARKGRTIDIGGGALKDSRYLLEQGFDVTVIDQAEAMVKFAEEITSDAFHAVVSSYADFAFPKNTYDLASAMYSLPFNPPETFTEVFEGIKQSLTKGGIFCGQFFGIHDEWSTNPSMTFHTKDQVEKLLEGMEIIFLEEREHDGTLANGTPKHWHLFDCIARKR